MIEKQMRLLTVYGTRPEAIKLAPVILSLQGSLDFQLSTCVTAQHREMLDQINQLFGIKPDFDLDLMEESQSLHDLSARILTGVTAVIEKINPDWILVQGDTTTAMVTSLAGYYQKIRVGHIEAGLRTKIKWEPFPEEINRRIIDVIADLHFVPTELAREHLLNEGVSPNHIVITGNTIVDALNLIAKKEFKVEGSKLAALPLGKKIVLVTAHRRENIGKPLENICLAIARLADTYVDSHFVFPVHRKPEVDYMVRSLLGDYSGVTLLPPLDYHSFIFLLTKCYFVMTDSGGIQEEAPTCGKKVLVLRNTTERPECVESGFAKVIGTESNRIVAEVSILLNDPDFLKLSKGNNPYGDGKASQRIIEALRNSVISKM
jgi:UDP-N-acetylglucosamine 2-epimerase (non-hydrolysing)